MNKPIAPKTATPTVPDLLNGEIYQKVGKYARGAVLFAFEQAGGPVGLAEWAENNKDDFYTKLFPKIIARESEVQHTRGVDELMDLLDGDFDVLDEGAAPEIEDAEVLEVDEVISFGAPASFTPTETDDVYADVSGDWDFDDMVEFPDE